MNSEPVIKRLERLVQDLPTANWDTVEQGHNLLVYCKWAQGGLLFALYGRTISSDAIQVSGTAGSIRRLTRWYVGPQYFPGDTAYNITELARHKLLSPELAKELVNLECQSNS